VLLTALLVTLVTGSGLLAYRSLASPGLEIIIPTSTAVKAITVSVVGAVAQPGLYTLGAGQRVQDAVVAAGGAAPDADLSRLNLAAQLRDGQEVYLPRRGEPLPLLSEEKDKRVSINLNLASAEILATLPGIGATRAQRIVEYRNEHGPFGRLEDLVELRLLPASVFTGLRDRLLVQ
jgi:competence protein ComEA